MRLATFLTVLPLALAAIVLIGGTPPAHAQIAAQHVIRDMLPSKRPIENVPIRNTSDDLIIKVTVDIFLTTKENDGEEILTPSDDIQAAPRNFVLKPGEERLVRLVSRKPPGKTKERIYRVKFKPSLPEEVEMPFGESNPDSVKTGVTVLTSMGILLTVAPLEQTPKLTWSRDENGVTFRNEGNVSIDLKRRDNFCFDEEGTDCMNLPGTRIVPSNSWTLPIASDKRLVYYQDIYGETSPVVVEPLD